MRARLAAVAFLLAASGAGAQGAAQAGAKRGVIEGVVSDSSLAPIAGADAWLLGSQVEVVTGTNGRFRITSLPPGPYVLIIRHIGFAPMSAHLDVAGDDTLRTTFMLAKSEVALEKMVITSTAGVLSPSLREFEARRAQGVGQFLTTKDIEKINFPTLSSFMNLFRGVTVTPDGKRAFSSRTGGSKSCPYQFVVDGVLLSPVMDIDRELPPPRDVAGVEVYANSATVPPQYASIGGGSMCGVIIIWTRR